MWPACCQFDLGPVKTWRRNATWFSCGVAVELENLRMKFVGEIMEKVNKK
jgi:hypothetical protein